MVKSQMIRHLFLICTIILLFLILWIISPVMSLLAQYFAQQQFCVLVEYLSAHQAQRPVRTQLAGFPTCMTLADRVHADDDAAPLQVAKHYPPEIEKVIHFSGKDRDIQDFEQFLQAAKAQGRHNLLLLTGDKLKQHRYSHEHAPRTRYLESINAVMAAKRQAGFHIGVAFNPFKYAEAEKEAQYLKLHKKIKAGADYVITQLGYDMAALQDVQAFLVQHQYAQKILACVMPLTLARAKFMQKAQVAGIVITPHMLQVLQQEKEQGLTDQVYVRCALQILMCQHLGFSGVHLSACHQPEEQLLLERAIESYRHLSLSECEQLWNTLWHVQTGTEFQPKLDYYSRPASSSQIIKYQQLHLMHEALFESKLGKGLGRFIFNFNVWDRSRVNQALLKTEHFSKHAVVGCESCGQCRLGETLYICPETCPKGLANGPCGGTRLDRCEFGDRECIHSVKARLAKAVGQTTVLKEALIPTVSIAVRGSSSWKNWYVDAAK